MQDAVKAMLREKFTALMYMLEKKKKTIRVEEYDNRNEKYTKKNSTISEAEKRISELEERQKPLLQSRIKNEKK